MIEVRYSTRFKRDVKTCEKRHYKLELMKQVIDTLRIPATLPAKNEDHVLHGNYAGYRECHIESDWLLIYRQDKDELLLQRTGTHSDLFGK